MDILEKQVFFEETIKSSVFLSELFICNSQSEARKIIKTQKDKYNDSSHVVHAFVIGQTGQIMGMSDDGEPSGTAGRPVLDVLKGRNCTNTLLTITRWFGGTLLGTGGLVKAYSNGAKSLIQKADKENAFVPLVLKKEFTFSIDYSLQNIIKKTIENFTLFDLSQSFDTNITFTGYIAESEYSVFVDTLKDVSNGKIIVKELR